MAEVGMVHDGSLMDAHAYIDAVADAGADAVKFQAHFSDWESTPGEPWRVRPKYSQDESRFAYWKRTAFRPDQWGILSDHAADRGLDFVLSAFSDEAVWALDGYVDAWKIASGEVGHASLLEAVRKSGRPIYLSTGMSTIDEIQVAMDLLVRSKVTVMQCTSIYPCPPELWGLGHISMLKSRYPLSGVGYSDHSGTIVAPVAAAVFGAEIVEVHVCWDKRQGGFDVESSLTIDELGELCDAISALNRAGDVPKDEMAERLKDMRAIFGDKWKRKAALA